MRRDCGRRRVDGRAGTTLVETVVTMLVVVLIMAMVVGILSPAAKIFLRMQKLQYAWMILDNTAGELREMAREASVYVKIYPESAPGTDGVAGMPGAEEGPVLEFVSPEGYVALLSAEGCGETGILLGDTLIDTAEEVRPGRLFARYYNMDNAANTYVYRKNGNPVARAVAGTFTDGYYMGNYLKVTFSYPPGIAEGGRVTYIVAKLCLYDHEERSPEHLVAQEEVVLDFRYLVERRDSVTAEDDAGAYRHQQEDTGGLNLP